MSLVEPSDNPSISGVQVPRELYWVLASPAPLAGMKYPRPDFPWSNLHAAGFAGVVAIHPGRYDPTPLSVLFFEHLEDLVHGGPPTDAVRELKAIGRAVTATLWALRGGQGVVVHCAGGRGRTGTVLGCALRELGHEPTDVITYLDRVHKARGTPGWPESPWQSALVRDWKPDA